MGSGGQHSMLRSFRERPHKPVDDRVPAASHGALSRGNGL
jgi:hypothetical protein